MESAPARPGPLEPTQLDHFNQSNWLNYANQTFWLNKCYQRGWLRKSCRVGNRLSSWLLCLKSSNWLCCLTQSRRLIFDVAINPVVLIKVTQLVFKWSSAYWSQQLYQLKQWRPLSGLSQSSGYVDGVGLVEAVRSVLVEAVWQVASVEAVQLVLWLEQSTES